MAVLMALQVLGITKEQWDKLPASKKQRIMKAIKEKDLLKARKIYVNPCIGKLRETEHFIYVKTKKGKNLKFKKPKWTKEKVKEWLFKRREKQ